MTNRYKYRKILNNDLEQYSEVFRNRNVNHIMQYDTPSFTYINATQYANLSIVRYTWSQGDRYSKIAQTYYGDPTLWWVIAKFNLKPTESHLKSGDKIDIPLPLDRVLEYMGG